MATPIHIDGMTLEGGGQLFRLALCLSSLCRTPVHVTDIRGNRGPPSRGGQDGGIKPAHQEGALWLARATQATTKGLELKSRNLLFQPARHSKEVGLEEAFEDLTVQDEEAVRHLTPVWQDVREGGRMCRRCSAIHMSTPGSIFLVLQAILPHILFSSQPPSSEFDQEAEAVPIRLVVTGGTNVTKSLSFEYAEQVLFPMFFQKLGIGPIDMKLEKRGWSMGSKCIGKVTFDITPLEPGSVLPSFDLSERGNLAKIHVSILAPSTEFQDGIKDQVVRELQELYANTEVVFPVMESSGHRARLYLLLVAEMSNGNRFGRDWLYDRRVDHKDPQKTIDTISTKVMEDLAKELEHGGCVDEYLQDQLTVFQALAKGISTIKSSDAPSLHTKTTRWVCEKLLGVSFDGDGHCEGIGLVAGEWGTKVARP